MVSFAQLSSRHSRIVAVIALLGAPARAHALQPLADFLAGARTASVDDREARLIAVAQDSNAVAALSRNLPAFTARGTYTHNQFEVDFPVGMGPPLLLQPLDQFDAFLQLDVPIVDSGSFLRTRAARADARAAKHNAQATVLDVEKQVARFYYQIIGAEALRRSAERNLAAAQANADLLVERRAGGIATELDVARASSEVERARQNIADAVLASELSRRALRTLTGIEAAGEAVAAVDDLHEEAPLAEWEATPEARVPLLLAAAEAQRGADANALAAKLALVPTLSATALERFTNATAFLFGHDNIFSLAVNLTWHFDFTTMANIRTLATTAEIAAVRRERARLAVRDQIHDAWERVRAGIAKGRAARAQVRAASLAAQYATERYASGTGTQLDVVQAQRDEFAADVALIQADADLAFSRGLLRLSAGQPLDGAPGPPGSDLRGESPRKDGGAAGPQKGVDAR